MDEFLALSRRFSRFGLTQDDIRDAVKSACDFFNIPQPRMIQDLTNTPGGQTMFVNWDRGSYYDDVLCFNMQQLIDMKVDTKEAFSLVMTHEAAHRVLQNTQFYGPNNGAWEQELCCDYFMGVRAGLWNMDVSKVTMGLITTSGSQTHPEGTLRALFIRYGRYHVKEMQQHGIPLTIQNLITEFDKIDFRYCRIFRRNKENILESERIRNMRISVPFVELTSYIAEHYGKEVMFNYVNSTEICVSIPVNALFISKTIGINISLLDVIDNDVKIGYNGGWGTDIIIKEIMKYHSMNMPTYNHMIEESNGNTLIVHLSKVEQLKNVLKNFSLDKICFGEDDVVVSASFR